MNNNQLPQQGNGVDNPPQQLPPPPHPHPHPRPRPSPSRETKGILPIYPLPNRSIVPDNIPITSSLATWLEPRDFRRENSHPKCRGER